MLKEWVMNNRMLAVIIAVIILSVLWHLVFGGAPSSDVPA